MVFKTWLIYMYKRLGHPKMRQRMFVKFKDLPKPLPPPFRNQWCEKVRVVTETRERLCSGIQEIGGLQIYGQPQLGLMIYGSANRDTQMIWQGMFDRGWFSPPLDEPPSIHLMLSPGHADHVDRYLEDLNDVVAKVPISAQNGHMRARYT